MDGPCAAPATGGTPVVPVRPPPGRRLSQLALACGALTGKAAILAAARRDASPHHLSIAREMPVGEPSPQRPIAVRASSFASLRDTQSGLCGFLSDMLGRMPALRGDRHEYETRMLVDMRRHPLPPLQIPIKTVYLEGNRSSH